MYPTVAIAIRMRLAFCANDASKERVGANQSPEMHLSETGSLWKLGDRRNERAQDRRVEDRRRDVRRRRAAGFGGGAGGGDRKSGVEGKSVSVSVEAGGRRMIKKKRRISERW